VRKSVTEIESKHVKTPVNGKFDVISRLSSQSESDASNSEIDIFVKVCCEFICFATSVIQVR